MQTISYPFNKCLYPKYVLNKYTHQTVEVNCGKCDACKMVRNSHYARLCDFEEEDHKYTMFVTLTYNPKYVPTIQPLYISDSCLDNTYFFVDQQERWINNDYISDNGQVLANDKCSPYWHWKYNSKVEFDKFMNFVGFKHTNHIRVLNKADLQKFLKRFRYYAKKFKCSTSFSYYAVGEYGPGKQRDGQRPETGHMGPHFHVLFYFDDWSLFYRFKEIVYKAWPYGFINFSQSRGRCSGYLSDYLNGTHRIPPLYGIKAFQPFSLHSSFFGAAFYKDKKEEIYRLQPEEFIRHTRRIGNKDTEVSVWRNLANIFYPRCRNFSTADDTSLYILYTCFYEAQSRFGKNASLQYLAQKVLEEGTSYSNYRCAEPFHGGLVQEFNSDDKSLFFRLLCFQDPLDRDSEHRTLDQVYYDLYVSKHFIDFVCNGYVFESRSNIQMIKRFYSKMKLFQLKNFYESQLVWSDIDYHYFYHTIKNANVFVDLKEQYRIQDLDVYKTWRTNSIIRAESAIKHKAQNAQIIPYL